MDNFDTFIASVYLLNFIIGLFGNSFVLIFLFNVSKVANPFNRELRAILLNLAIADILTEVFGIIAVSFAYLVKHPEGVQGDVICKVFTSYSMTWTFTNISVLTLCLMTMERYKGLVACRIRDLLHANHHKRFIATKLIFVWILGVILYIPYIPFQFYNSENGCHEVFPSNKEKYTIVIGDYLLFFTLPTIFFVGVYTKIIKTLNKSAHDTDKNMKLNIRSYRKKITKITAYVVFGFLICWGPAYTLYTVQVIWNIESASYDKAYDVSLLLSFVASTSHPVIYSLQSKLFREKIKFSLRTGTTNLLKCFPKCRTSRGSVMPVNESVWSMT